MTTGQGKTAIIWNRDILPYSQTFIANQMSALARWKPVLLGERRVHGGLSAEPRYVLADGRHTNFTSASFRLFRRSKSLTNAVSELGGSFIHAHFGWSGVDIAPTARKAGLPLIVTFHGSDITRALRKTSPSDSLYWHRLLATFEHASHIVAISNFIAERLVALGAPQDKIRVLYVGTEVRPLATTAARRGILFVGRLIEKKGIVDLVNAVGKVRPDFPTVPFTIVGSGPLQDHLKYLSQQVGAEAVFAGAQDTESVRRLMESHEILCGPSHSEGLGMVFLEAAERGLPVVATRQGGIPEAVRHEETGVLVKAGSVDEIATALRRLLIDPELARAFGAAGRKHIRKSFEIGKCTVELEGLYDMASNAR